MRRQKQRCLASLLCLVLAACGYPPGKLDVPEPDYDAFALSVYPVLLRDCGFPACHGTHARFFEVFGPGRTRLTPDTPAAAPATAEERALTYTRACSMLTDPHGIAHSPLLRKPLARAAGGPGHGGDDVWGRGVYASRHEAGYLALREWALSLDEDAGDAGISDASPSGDGQTQEEGRL